MKNAGLKASVVALGLLAVVSASASAQEANNRLIAKIPFTFVVGQSVLPAGDYAVSESPEHPGVLLIVNAGHSQALWAMTRGGASAEATPPELVFQRFGTQYYLARFVGPNTDVRDLPLRFSIQDRASAEAGSPQRVAILLRPESLGQ